MRSHGLGGQSKLPRGAVFAALAVVAACADNGAHLTFVAPEGPTNATSFRVVLAAPDPVQLVPGQRMTTDPNAGTQMVPYYLQKTLAGGSSELGRVDGMTVKIAPESDTSDTTFIPFVLLYDGDGAIVGVGTFHKAGAAEPSEIIVMPDEIDKYEITIEPVTQVTDMDHAAAGQVMVVDCASDNQSTFTSGIVWRPKAGGELRLLFPNDGGIDATGRQLDLDCDGHPVTAQSSGGDCDDSRGWFNRDAQDTCDGFDTNCDGLQSLAVACPSAGGTVCVDAMTQTGIAICDDRTGTQGACQSDPGCLCAANPTACTNCKLIYALGSGVGAVKPCQPGVGMLGTQGKCSANGLCTVDVLGVRGPWKVEVSSGSTGSFGSRATGVAAQVGIKAKLLTSSGELMAVNGQALGEVDLLITTANSTTYYLGLELQLAGDAPVVCAGQNGVFSMQCSP